MNIHHLELFFYVATHKGIGLAVRHMPYGIQQPAISSQLIDLEKNLGTVLFQRRPFLLTPAGEELFRFITPFFANLPQMSKRLQGTADPLLRLGSTPTIIRNHLPTPLKRLRATFPDFKLALREIDPTHAEDLLQQQEIDIAVAFWERKPAGGVKFERLGALSMALLIPADLPFKTADQVLRHAVERGTGLITLPPGTTLTKTFQQELARRDLAWKQTVEVNSLDLIQTYVADGFGFGLSVHVPNAPIPPGVRLLPLKGYPPLTIGLFWLGKMTPIVQGFADEMRGYVHAAILPPAAPGKQAKRN